MRLVMMGTGPFAAPTFRALYAAGHDVVSLITRPARNLRDRYKGAESPLPPIAAEHGTPVASPEDVNSPESRSQLAAWRADLFVVCDYGQILSPEALAASRLGGINLHGSLLPKYRGAAPINWAIFHGESETGVTVIHMTPGLDAGPCILQASTPIGLDETSADIESRLSELGAPLVCRAIELLARGEARPIPQNPALATRARRLRKDDGEIDWSRPAAAVHNQVRAFQPWPRAATTIARADGAPIRLMIDKTRFLPQEELTSVSATTKPGEIVAIFGEELIVATGDGRLALVQVQPAGKRRMSAGEFARGYRIKPGDRLERGHDSTA